MFKSTRGSVTLMAYAAMIFFALYGVLLFGNAARKYKIQTEAINTITSVYTVEFGNEQLSKIYLDNGGKTLQVD